jgi:hypothetical protein
MTCNSGYDFTIEQGSSFKMSMTYKDAEGNPNDLTGWCARIIWTTNLNQVQVFSTQNVDYSVYKFVIEPADGKLIFMLPSSTTNNFNFKTARYDLELQSPDLLYAEGGNYTTKILFGTITIAKRYSKSNTELDCNL